MYDWEELEDAAKAPNLADIRAHLEWLVAPARGQYDDALIEIAFESNLGAGPNRARLFSLDELDEAAAFAAKVNGQKVNTYVGASLKSPDTDRAKRSSGGDFYVATAVPVDIDTDYDAVRQRMAQAVDDGLIVVTGLTPSRRSQHWVRLVTPCDDETEFGQAFEALVSHVGADFKVKDAARVMRLGGTISYPPPKKASKGYVTELTTIVVNAQAEPEAIDGILALPAGERSFTPGASRGPTGQAAAGEIERSWSGLVTDGRESHWRNIVARLIRQWQEDTGSDPEAADIWQEAWETFTTSTDNRDGRWTNEAGQRELRKRLANTLRRLKSGHLARFGLSSIETGIGEAEAKEVARKREETRREQRERRAEAPTESPIPPGDHLFKSSPEFTANYTPAEYLVEPLVQRGYCYSFTAPTGHGKTAIAMNLAACVGLGRKFAGCETLKGRVGYFAAENPTDVQARWIVMQDALKFAAGDAEVYFAPLTLDIEQHFATIEAEAQRVGGFDLVIVDTSQAFFYGDDENSNAEMVAHAKKMRRLTTLPGNPCTIVLCHPLKNAAKDNLLPRGGGGFLAEVDGNLTAWKDEELVVMHHAGKLRGPGFPPINFELKSQTSARLIDAKGRQLPSVLAVAMAEDDYSRRMVEQGSDQDKVLVLLLSTKGRISVADICDKCGWVNGTGLPNKGKAHRIIRQLLGLKLIKQDRRGRYVVTASGKAEIGGKARALGIDGTDDDEDENAF